MIYFFLVEVNLAKMRMVRKYKITQDTNFVWISEVSLALVKFSNIFAAGLGQVLYGVWKSVYLVNLNIILTLIKDTLT